VRSEMRSLKEVSDLVEREILGIAEARVADRIRQLLVVPYPVERLWEYGAPGDRFTCWTVLEHPESNTGIAFCSEGFGPSYPWGLVPLSGPHMGIGMDSGWFVALEQAFRDSLAWNEPNGEGYESQ
jgi:hypothetical protein